VHANENVDLHDHGCDRDRGHFHDGAEHGRGHPYGYLRYFFHLGIFPHVHDLHHHFQHNDDQEYWLIY